MKKTMKIEHVRAISREGKEVMGGELIDVETFAKYRSARLEISGKVEVEVAGKKEVKDVQLVYTRRSCSEGEFRGLCELIGQKGDLEGEFSNFRTTEVIRGKRIKLPAPRVDLKLTANDGSFAPKFKAEPVATWASKYGHVGTEYVNFGTSEEGQAKGRERLRQIREEAPDATAPGTDVSI